jgi:hypothetical protein
VQTPQKHKKNRRNGKDGGSPPVYETDPSRNPIRQSGGSSVQQWGPTRSVHADQALSLQL